MNSCEFSSEIAVDLEDSAIVIAEGDAAVPSRYKEVCDGFNTEASHCCAESAAVCVHNLGL